VASAFGQSVILLLFCSALGIRAASSAQASSVGLNCVKEIYRKYPDADLDLSSVKVEASYVLVSDVYLRQGRAYKYRYKPYERYPWACGVNSSGRVIKVFRPIDADMD